jgi:hypothetical protein
VLIRVNLQLNIHHSSREIGVRHLLIQAAHTLVQTDVKNG